MNSYWYYDKLINWFNLFPCCFPIKGPTKPRRMISSSPPTSPTTTVNQTGDAIKGIQDQERWATVAAADRVLFTRMKKMGIGTNAVESQAEQMVYARC